MAEAAGVGIEDCLGVAKAAEQRQDVIQLDGGRAFKYPQEQQWCPLISSPAEDTLCLGTRQVHGRPVTLLRPPLTTAGNAWGKPKTNQRPETTVLAQRRKVPLRSLENGQSALT